MTRPRSQLWTRSTNSDIGRVRVSCIIIIIIIIIDIIIIITSTCSRAASTALSTQHWIGQSR